MNILIYTDYYPAPEKYGMPADTHVIRYFAEKLKEKGHNVRVVRLFYRPLKELRPGSVRFVLPRYADYEMNGIPVHLIRYQMLEPKRTYPQRFQAALINRHLKKWKSALPDKADRVFVHFPSLFGGLDEIFSGTGAVMGDLHNIDVTVLRERDKSGAARNFVRKLHVLGYRNNRVRDYLAAEFGSSGAALHRVYTGIDSSLLASKDIIEARKRASGDVLRVIYAGQLIPLKNVDILVQAFRKLDHEAELVIVGDGEEAARIRELADGDPRIRFTGWLEREQATELMANADVLAMVSSPESYGMVYLEAMAKGTIPVAAVGEGFDGIIVNGENGFLVQPRDVDALARVLADIRRMSPEDRARLIDNAYQTACGLTEDRTTDLFLELNQ
ncbi:MAG: glycosyltransferase family 4 protein [Clostridia bacterium]|nr:glycosyltransferase family 4 protein [Clostridia bacterium]